MKVWKKALILLLVVGMVSAFAVASARQGGIWEVGKVWLGKGVEEEEGLEKAEEPLRFVVVSDIHSDWGNFRKALGRVRSLGPAFAEASAGKDVEGFVIVTGDLTTIGKKSELLEAKKILDESGLKYYVIPGNHDIWWGRKYRKDVWGGVFGESFMSFKIDGTKFILINNGDGIGGVGSVRGIGDIGEMDWLEEEIKECLKLYCLVFLHEPLNHPNSLHVMGEEDPSVASEAAQLIKLFVDNNVQEIFAGHLHFSSSYVLEGLKTTIVGAVASERNFQSPKFLEVTKEGSSLETRDIFLSN